MATRCFVQLKLYGLRLGQTVSREVEHMLWTKPKVVEISCGLEINSYVRAEL